MVWVAFILAILLLIATAIIFFVDAGSTLASATGWAIFLGLLALVIALIIIAYIIMHRNKIQYCGVFLQNASLMIREKCVMTLLYIPLFMLFTILFCILIVFEYLSFSSVASPVQESGSLYLKLVRSFWFMAPLVIQTLWGLSFFRDACNL
jgi:preprotein translocase subunit SecG